MSDRKALCRRRGRWLAAVVGLAAWAWPAVSRAADPPKDEDAPAPRYPPSRARVPLVAGGLTLTGLAYGVGALSAATWPEVPGSDWLFVPVVGPWAALAQSGCAADDPNCEAILYLRGLLYIVGGLAQLGGVAIASEAIVMTTEADKPPPKASWLVTPIVTPKQSGIGVVGTF